MFFIGSDINIRVIPFPYNVKAVTLPCNDGSFDIYINANLCEEYRMKALIHELEHIKHNHFYSYEDIAIQELVANKAY